MSEPRAVFGAGDAVRVRADAMTAHHRTPAYVKGRTGRVAALCGAFANPEMRAYGSTGLPRVPLYRVEFDQTEVWDDYQGPASDKVHVDVFEHWLEPA